MSEGEPNFISSSHYSMQAKILNLLCRPTYSIPIPPNALTFRLKKLNSKLLHFFYSFQRGCGIFRSSFANARKSEPVYLEQFQPNDLSTTDSAKLQQQGRWGGEGGVRERTKRQVNSWENSPST